MKNKKSVTPLYKLGWLPDVPDKRDIPFSQIFRVPAKVPARVDLRGGCSPVEQQGELGSCTAQALVGALEFLELRKDGHEPFGLAHGRQARPLQSNGRREEPQIAASPRSGASGHLAPGADVENSFRDLSRLFVYYNERATMGTTQEDSGAMLRTGIKDLKRLGVCKEASWPYIIARFTHKPPAKCYQEAKKHQVTAYQRLASISEMKACLAMGLPFVFGFAVYAHVMTEEVRKTGIIKMPRRNERMLGGHAVMAVGYDEKRKIFSFRNSWGMDWGQKGYGALPYAYLESRELSDDFWCIQATESNLYALWRLPGFNQYPNNDGSSPA